jgi:hypothetical protein
LFWKELLFGLLEMERGETHVRWESRDGCGENEQQHVGGDMVVRWCEKTKEGSGGRRRHAPAHSAATTTSGLFKSIALSLLPRKSNNGLLVRWSRYVTCVARV